MTEGPPISRRSLLMAVASGSAALAIAASSGAYGGDDSSIRSRVIRTLSHYLTLMADDGRRVRVSVWPAWGERRGLILFSHGALSAPEKYERLIGPWNAAGFEVMAPLHVDSTDHPDHARYGMIESWRARLLDMRALSAHANEASFIAAGHSYGGLVALTLGGAAAEVPPGLTVPLSDARVNSVVALSPPGVSPGLMTQKGYGTLRVPAFIQTGDRDVPFDSKDGRWQAHLAAYEAAPPVGDKYALVLQGVDHYFGGLICKFDVPGPTQSAQLTATIALSTMFMDAYALHDQAASALLEQALQPGTAVEAQTLLRK